MRGEYEHPEYVDDPWAPANIWAEMDMWTEVDLDRESSDERENQEDVHEDYAEDYGVWLAEGEREVGCKMILAIDFDGTIHDYKNPTPGRKMGPPVRGARDALVGLKASGHTIHIYTIWRQSSHGAIRDWMDYYDIPFDHVTNIKGQADAYIDDKAIRFTNWEEVIGIVG